LGDFFFCDPLRQVNSSQEIKNGGISKEFKNNIKKRERKVQRVLAEDPGSLFFFFIIDDLAIYNIYFPSFSPPLYFVTLSIIVFHIKKTTIKKRGRTKKREKKK
jgi:hypothetical protein